MGQNFGGKVEPSRPTPASQVERTPQDRPLLAVAAVRPLTPPSGSTEVVTEKLPRSWQRREVDARGEVRPRDELMPDPEPRPGKRPGKVA